MSPGHSMRVKGKGTERNDVISERLMAWLFVQSVWSMWGGIPEQRPCWWRLPHNMGSLVKATVHRSLEIPVVALGFFMVFHPTLVQGRIHGVELVENVRPRSHFFFSCLLWSHYHVFGSMLHSVKVVLNWIYHCSVGWIPVISTWNHAVGSLHRFGHVNLHWT